MKKSILNLKNKTVGDIVLDTSIFGIKGTQIFRNGKK